MKTKFCLILVITLFFITNLYSTFTRIRSLGDIENPVDGKISGLIKDDIVDIYFNPAKVNEIKNYLIISALNLKFGTGEDEYLKQYKLSDDTPQISEKTTEIINQRYNFKVDTGIITPLKVMNIFLNYTPEWMEYKKEERISEVISGLTNIETYTTNYIKEVLLTPTPLNIVLGFNFSEKLLLGLKSGYKHTEYNRYKKSGGIEDEKAEYKSDEFNIGAGTEFFLNERLSLSIAGDFIFWQKDEYPLDLKELSQTNALNYDKNKKIYNYNFTEKVGSYNLRFYPELRLQNEKFFRFLLGINYYNYSKSYKFNPNGDFANMQVKDFSKDEIILSSGVSYNYNFSPSVLAIYGIKYTGCVYSKEEKVEVSRNVDIDIEKQDHFLGGFAGFDSKVSPMVYIRVGLSQGFYRYFKLYNKWNDKLSGKITETTTTQNEFLPQTAFALGLYVKPIKKLSLELNFLGLKDWSDWNMENVSISQTSIKIDGKEKEKINTRNFDFQIGVSISYSL